MGSDSLGGYTREALEPCVNLNAPIVKCVICKRDVYTCERTEAVDGNYSCPVHPDGVELSRGGDWVCSEPCWDAACKIAELQQQIDDAKERIVQLEEEYKFTRAAIREGLTDEQNVTYPVTREKVLFIQQDRDAVLQRIAELEAQQTAFKPETLALVRRDERIAELEAALREARCWIVDGSRRTPEQRGAHCETCIDALEMVDKALL